MRKHFKKYFIPHEGNEYRPHIFRGFAVTVIALVALAAFVFAGIHTLILVNSTDFLAAVLPRVLIDHTNDSRTENNLSQLTVSPTLVAAAQLKANDMAEHSYFAHVSPDGITPWHWFIEAGYSFAAAGENLAVNFSDSEAVVEAWLDSPGHRANIMSAEFTEIGIATARGVYKGQDTIFVVQLFGRPALAQAPQVPETVAETPEETDDEEPIPAVAASSAEAPEERVETVAVPTPIQVVVPESEEEQQVAEENQQESEQAEEVTEVPETLEVIHEDNLFVAVRDPEAEQNQELAGAEAVGLLAPQEASFFEHLLTQPRSLLQNFYFILGALILLTLIIGIIVEIERQHPRHILYGILLFVLVVALAYIFRHFIFTELLII